MNEEQLKKIAEEFKKTLSIEELDELEREYNALYKKLKEEHESKSSIEKND
jgi:effector-binding domain-containing protein